jgi:NAD(P)-dependent dehydrogenase (short-subunit alcohol dehydrogenase family)
MGTRRSQDSRAVVTGAGSGIGAAFATELARRGGRVVCSDLDVDAAQRTVDRIAEQGGKALAVRCDVASLADVQALADEAQSWFSAAPTLVINNAGIGAGGTAVGETPIEEWDTVLAINLTGVIYGCHVFVPVLRAAGRGGVINVASAASFTSAPTMGPYNVSKAGVVALSETLAAEFSGTGLRVTVLCPTFVKTNILRTEHIPPRTNELAERMMRLTGMSPDRVARTCLDAHDRGRLYVLPQLEAKALWRTKRMNPGAFTRATGLLGRITPS